MAIGGGGGGYSGEGAEHAGVNKGDGEATVKDSSSVAR